MPVQESECVRHFIRLCEDAFAQGWHEANGGNLSYRMSKEDVAQLTSNVVTDSPWHELLHPYPELADSCFIISGSGKYLHNAAIEPEGTLGIIELDSSGKSWRTIWGLESARPSSELETHLAIYESALNANDGADRIVYHAHCPNIISLSTVLEPDMRTWTRTLWQCMTESIIVFPQGIGVLPWMVPGSAELARATREIMGTYRICVWTQHGLTVRAKNFDEAFGLVHTIEKSAGIHLQARAASGGNAPQHLVTDNQLRAVCARYGITPNEEFLD